MSEKKFLLLLFLFTSICLFSNLSVFEADLMEARNFVTAREMLADGHWWETTMNGAPRLEKPPLPTWITAIFGSLSADFSNWFLRFPAAIMGILLVFWVYGLAKSMLQETDKARWSAIVCASSILFIQMARTGTWDIYFVSFAIGSFMHLYRGLIIKQKVWLNVIAAGLLLGFSILSKGPVAGIMLVAFIAGLLHLSGFKSLLETWKQFLALGLLAGIIGFSWPVYNLFFLPEATDAVIAKESITWTTKHVKPFYFYLAFPLQMGIWAIPAILICIPKLAKEKVGKTYFSLIIWLGLTILLLSLLPMKKERYLLPVIPVISILIGSFLSQEIKKEFIKFKNIIFKSSFGLVAIAFLASPIAIYIIQEKHPFATDLFTYIGFGLLFIIGLLLTWSLIKNRNKLVLQLLCLSVVVTNISLLPFVAKVHYKHPNYISPIKHMKNPELQNKPLYGIEEPDMRVIHELKTKLLPLEEAKKAVIDKPIYVLSSEKFNDVLKHFPNYVIEKLDSTSHHKTARHYGLVAYKISSE